ncbi:4-amino-4-deoxy-L-arabinose transferase-like glycosyltransferase [Microvirga flocculans]|uniref:4-amino-4-deoxy-L-arabinose transferase-like glycosyltransferase n=1 Tax=Microvirga flocculans TaxID=217168 RepID=A0A7W6II10_9HYPH|nr:glycosyltransferase family 39 protein [Microvirga flocculans]MBB4041709.1 4-amino-4-deoxy-L-arabinose transferase-like glycosyltransferase [Microvirga flocculans]
MDGSIPQHRVSFRHFSIDRLTSVVERSHARICAVLVLLSLVCFLPGFTTLQPMDRDEPRYAQASKQMLETGDFVDIRFQDEARHKKPVGIYWMQSASVAMGQAFGVPEARTTIALYRIPSLFGAIAAVLLTYWAALAFFGRRGAFLTAALMATCVILMVEARLAKTDAMLTACSVAVMGGLARAYLSRGAGTLPRRALLIFWTGFALGILIKGPLVLMFAGFAAAILSYKERSARWLLSLRPWLGLVFTLAVVLPWFIAIAIKSGGAFFAASVGQDMLGKVGTAQKYHWAPPGFYLLSFFATFWPGAILAAIAVPFAWKHRREEPVAFALAWIVPSWIVFEAVPTKLPHYTLPLLPAVAIVTVMAISRHFVGPHRPAAKLATILIPFIPVGLTVGLSAVAWSFDGLPPFRALPALLAASLLSLWAWWLFAKNRMVPTLWASFVASAFLAIGVFGFAQLDLRSLKISDRLAEAARNVSCENPQVATLGYREPSLVFLVGTTLDMVDTGAEAAAFLRRGGCRVVFVDKRFEGDFRAENERLKQEPELTTRINGFNINSGKRVDIAVYAVGS